MIRTGSVVAVCLLLLAGPCLAGTKIEKELKLQPGGSFVLDTDNGTVDVTGSDRSGVRVVITSKLDDLEQRYDVIFKEDPGQVTITVDKKSSGLFSWFKRMSGSGLRFAIELPRQTDIDIDTAGGSIKVEAIDGVARLDTSGGGIVVSAVTGEVMADTSGGSIDIETVDGDVSADTSGGHIHVVDVRGDVYADTSGGPIDIENVSGDVNADTSGGSIRVIEAEGLVNADTSGGNIDVLFAAGNGSGGRLSTSGGGIRVSIDPSVGMLVDAETSGGSVKLGLPVTVMGEQSKSTIRGKIGEGGSLLKLRTSGSGIEIDPR
jgi:DUF4097 and DUF4098 domain-containing protein YvlB